MAKNLCGGETHPLDHGTPGQMAACTAALTANGAIQQEVAQYFDPPKSALGTLVIGAKFIGYVALAADAVAATEAIAGSEWLAALLPAAKDGGKIGLKVSLDALKTKFGVSREGLKEVLGLVKDSYSRRAATRVEARRILRHRVAATNMSVSLQTVGAFNPITSVLGALTKQPTATTIAFNSARWIRTFINGPKVPFGGGPVP